ncbi:MAG: LTA synthase family protein [Gammaproteobacteria bacterium]
MLRILKPIVLFALGLILILTLTRLGLAVWLSDRVSAVGGDSWWQILVQGMRFDAMTLSFLLLFALPLTLLLGLHRTLLAVWRPLLLAYLAAVAGTLVFMEAATPSFIEQYDARPNAIFFEYLKYPREVFSTLLAAYKLPLLLGIAATAVAVVVSWRWLNRTWPEGTRVRWWEALLAAPLLFLILAGTARGSFDHRPANPSTAAFSPDPLVNDLALNSTYTVAYAAYSLRHEEQGGFRYTDMSEQQVLELVREAMGVDEGAFGDPEIPTLHRLRPGLRRERPKNIVIVLEESLGAEFVGAMGGKPLTPRLDRLFHEGIWFENLYATGTRSVRGIEAVVAGFPPTPARSVVKLNGAQRNFFTLAQLLKRQGYRTSFIYGGESHFDNMARFFLGNGFDRVIDKDDYENPIYFGSWGVCDEDLFNRAHEEFIAYGQQPFFSLVFTTSNHSPYEYPEGRIAPQGDPNTVDNAVRYADYALGHFFDLARASSYWDDTLFLVVADHNSRVYGASLVPIERFHIPALILGGGVPAEQVKTVASQIDLLPTLLSLAGVEADLPAIGRDLSDPKQRARKGRAIMQYYTTQAYMEGDRVIILQKDREAETYRYREGTLIPESISDVSLMNQALAHSRWPQLAYRKRLYRLQR